ncbi:MAG: hypothetical protein LAO21_17930 [Acidobacteriia bacterium]|nr:hypothetical protein [Terriglobia bacterium]
MKHYDITEWSDFARGLTEGIDRSSMERHLELGCSQCRRTARLFIDLARIAKAEPQFQVPLSVERLAKAILAMNQPEKLRRLPRFVPRLVFDSFRSPLPAGVRSRQGMTRQALYRDHAANFSLDLRLDHEPGSSQVVLVGQIANFKEPSKRHSHVPVFLLAGRDIVARTVSNQLGEFQLECQAKKRLRLCVPVNDMETTRLMEISLNQLVKGKQIEDSALRPKRAMKKDKK